MIDLPSYFEGVKQTGPDRYLCRCSSHEDKSPSLSLRWTGDKWLVHCFSGCEARDVVHAIGLELSDLFEDSNVTHVSHHKPTRRRIPARDILEALSHEAHVVAIIAADLIEKKDITPEVWSRLATAASRIGAARDMSR